MPSTHANKWFVDFNDLDSDQKRLVKNGVFENGSNIGLINGPAGSGKTIILVNALTQAETNSVAFISYTKSLLNLANQGLPSYIKALTYHKAVKENASYDLIVIDEVQDVPADALSQIISKAKKVILAGDNFQKIFENGADSTTLNSICNNNIYKLLKTYRLTPRAFAAANKIFPNAMEGVLPSGKSVVPIELYYTDTYDQGSLICHNLARTQAALRRTAAILLPTRNAIVGFANAILASEGNLSWSLTKTEGKFPTHDFGSLNRYLKSNNVKLQIVQNDFGDINDAFENNETIVQTYHSAKGLDYQIVCLPNFSVESASKDQFQKSLCYVALTRASGALIITQQHNNVSPYVKAIEEFCTVMDANRITNDKDEF